jgi:hypothetical protein
MDSVSRGDPGDAAEHRSPSEADGVPAKRRLLAGLLLAFCCGHAVFLLVSIIPAPPAQDDPGNPALDLYRLVLGGRQRWNMFETIPILHSLDVRLEGADAAGHKIIDGPVLPDFAPYPTPEDSRYYVLFYRLMFFDNKVPFRDAYLRKTAQLLQAARGSPVAGENWSLVADTAFTRNLFHIRRDGQLSMPVTKTFPLVTPGGDPR